MKVIVRSYKEGPFDPWQGRVTLCYNCIENPRLCE